MPRTRSLVVARDDDLVVERDPGRSSGRLLRQDGMDASYVDLGDARHLEFDYLRWIRLIVRTFGAQRVLHVGGAACTLARALLVEDRDSRQEVVEIDARVIELARTHLGLRRQPGLRVRIGDGRQLISAHADGSFDAIVIDAFLGARVPRHLVTLEAFSECVRVAPLTIVNVADTSGWPDARAVAAGLTSAHACVAALASDARMRGNVILFGASSELNHRRLESAAAADRAPARLLPHRELGGGTAWLDSQLTSLDR